MRRAFKPSQSLRSYSRRPGQRRVAAISVGHFQQDGALLVALERPDQAIESYRKDLTSPASSPPSILATPDGSTILASYYRLGR
jgi:hypothetical protein